MIEIAVLGPTGNIGSALLRLLQGSPSGVRTGNRQDFDYFQPKTYGPFFKGATHLFLLTPVVDSMVELTAELVRAAKEAGIRKIVKVSALGARADSPARLLRWHAESEAIVRDSGIAWTILRPNALMQNFIQHYGRNVRAKSLIAVPASDARISFVDASDVARLAAASLESDDLTGQTLSLTGPRAWSFAEAADLFSLMLQRKITYVDTPEEKAREVLKSVGHPIWKVDALLEMYRHYRAGEAGFVTDTTARTLESFLLAHREEFL
jgi:uncharacterized protein YbjT (DUF2867 family)